MFIGTCKLLQFKTKVFISEKWTDKRGRHEQSDPHLSVVANLWDREATSSEIKGGRNASNDWFAQGKLSSDFYRRDFKQQICFQAFQIRQEGVWMFAHSWGANIHLKGGSRPARLPDR